MVFCTIPTFASSVSAQEVNNQARLLLELQSMRQEIAELRDMVERQQYELQRMQRSMQSNNSPQALGANNGSDIESVASQENSGINGSQANVPIQSGQVETQNPTANNNDFYRPYDSGNASQNTEPVEYSANQTNSPAPVVDANVISVPQPSTVSGLPPVDERVIQPNTSSTADLPTVSETPVQVPIDASGSPVANQVPVNEQPQTPNLNTGSGDSVPIVPIPPTSAIEPIASSSTNPTTAQEENVEPLLSEEGYYQQGFELLKQSKHNDAVEIFKKQINAYPNGDLVDDAHYWIAESMYVNRSLDISKQYFRLIIDNYKQSPRVPDAMLKTAYIEQEQGNEIEARILLQEIIQFHPRSNAAISAKNRLTDLG